MKRSRESDWSPAALPLFIPRNMRTMTLGEIYVLGLLRTLERVVTSLLLRVCSGKLSEGGVRLRSTLRFPSSPSSMGATLSSFPRRAPVDLRLSTSAAACACFCTFSGESAKSLGVLLTTVRLSSYSCLIWPDRNKRRRWWISWLRELLLGSSLI